MRESFGYLIGRPIECVVSRLTSYKVSNKREVPNKGEVSNKREVSYKREGSNKHEVQNKLRMCESFWLLDWSAH